MSKLILIEKQVDGRIVEYPLESFRVTLRSQPGAMYLVVEQNTWTTPDDLILRRKGDMLEVEIDGWLAAHIDDFYVEGMSATFSLGGAPAGVLIVHGGKSADVADGAVVWQAEAPEAVGEAASDAESDQVWQAEAVIAGDETAAEEAAVAWQTAGNEDGGTSNWVWGGLAAGGGIALATAAGGGGRDEGGTTPVPYSGMVLPAAEAGLNATEKTGGVAVELEGTVAGDTVTIYWGDLTHTYLVQAGDVDGDGIATITVPESIVDAVGDGSIEIHSRINDGERSPAVMVTVDTIAPVITHMALDNTALRAEETTPLIITFNEAVIGFDNSDITLENGTLTAVASSDGGITWTGSFTPADGIEDGTNVISVGTNVSDRAGNRLLAGAETANFSIDSDVPNVSSIAVTGATGARNRTLNAGDRVSVTVTMDQATTVTGTPQLALNIGSTVVQADYDSGSGTADLVFAYTIQAGENDASGISIDADSLSLNGGTLDDAAGNNAVLSHSMVSDNANYLVDTTAPVFTSGATAAPLDENSGSAQAIYTAATTDTGAVTYALKSGVGDGADFSIDTGSGAVILNGNPDYETKSSYSFTVIATDAAGNSSEQAVTMAINDIADEIPPTISGIAITGATGARNSILNTGDAVSVTVTMDEATTVTGTPQLALNIGGTTVQADYDSGSGTTDLVFVYTIQAGVNDAGGISIDADSLSLNDGTLRDAAGNSAVLTHSAVADHADYPVDTAVPTLNFSSPADDATGVVMDSNITLAFDEEIALGSSGSIIITDGMDSHTIDVSNHAGQLDVSGNILTIDLTADLANDRSVYHVEVNSGAVEDFAGNEYAGISDATTLNFTTIDTGVVVFDLVNGNASDHSGRTFDSAETYTIYVIVDSDSFVLNTGGDNWGQWTGGNNLGSDDTIVIVGDNGPIDADPGIGLPAITDGGFVAAETNIHFVSTDNGFLAHSQESLAITNGGSIWRKGTSTMIFMGRVSNFNSARLWTSAASDMRGPTGADHYLQNITQMPAGILTSQGLA